MDEPQNHAKKAGGCKRPHTVWLLYKSVQKRQMCRNKRADHWFPGAARWEWGLTASGPDRSVWDVGNVLKLEDADEYTTLQIY